MDRKQNCSLTFLVLTLLFCVCLIAANLLEIKIVGLGPLTITAGFIVFPLSYIINDCIVEIYGFRRARLVIWLGFAMNLFVSLLMQAAILLPNAGDDSVQQAMTTVYGAVPRIFAASFVAFLCGSMMNAWIMSRMKRTASNAPAAFSLRAIVSTLWGEGVDSAIFFPMAFGGILSWREIAVLAVTQALLKTLYEILVLPVTLLAVRRLRKIEGESGAADDNNPLTENTAGE
ncbi:MAG: queuosine precursor transporter [Clostridium sp.]|nr:queuosine precursor transporter [Clostridium sp.]